MQLQGEAIPNDKRFESIKSNFELLTKYKNTKNAATLKVSARKELFGEPRAQPDYA